MPHDPSEKLREIAGIGKNKNLPLINADDTDRKRSGHRESGKAGNRKKSKLTADGHGSEARSGDPAIGRSGDRKGKTLPLIYTDNTDRKRPNAQSPLLPPYLCVSRFAVFNFGDLWQFRGPWASPALACWGGISAIPAIPRIQLLASK